MRTPSMSFTRMTIAARLALAPQPASATPAPQAPVPDSFAAMAQTLARPESTEVESRETAAKVDVSAESRACEGEVSGDAEDRGPASLMGATPGESRQARDTQALRELIGRRIREARELLGGGQTELATWLAYRNSTQASLWEAGQRLPPIGELPRIAGALGVSLDYLFGLSDDPEREPRQVRRLAVVAQVRAAVDAMADQLADSLLREAAPLDGLVRSVKLVGKVERLVSAVTALRASNAELFDTELRGGATLVRAAAEARDAAQEVGLALDAADRAAELAHARLRDAVRKAAA